MRGAERFLRWAGREEREEPWRREDAVLARPAGQLLPRGGRSPGTVPGFRLGTLGGEDAPCGLAVPGRGGAACGRDIARGGGGWKGGKVEKWKGESSEKRRGVVHLFRFCISTLASHSPTMAYVAVAKALYDYQPQDPDTELAFNEDHILYIIDKEDDE